MNAEIKLLKEKVKELKVLYTEDEDEMREGTVLFLKKFFSSVDSRSDGKQGLEKFKESRYDVIFTDIMMPNMNGTEMLENIRRLDDNVFTIMLTASDIQESDVKKYSDLYFRKPISYENMIYLMKEIVKKFDL